ncbi:hypothetical protein C5167_002021 [Papaver somniferum]|uniref:Uncharacterized protein n=1 Tax=Papaver somniferum TaxID=3469 RepID=A0A4Y7KXY7_PAPSO|nr:hypothetical protein C5167_002021 [Papaver somniferum]
MGTKFTKGTKSFIDQIKSVVQEFPEINQRKSLGKQKETEQFIAIKLRKDQPETFQQLVKT